MRCPNCGHDNIPGVDLCDGCGSDLAGLDLPEADAGVAGRLMTDRLADARPTPPLRLAPQDSVRQAIELMREERHGCVLVHVGEALVGIVTERDVLCRVVLPDLDPSSTTLGEVMTPRPITLSENDPPAFAIYRMTSQGLRHVPITRAGHTVGFISVRNMLGYLEREILSS